PGLAGVRGGSSALLNGEPEASRIFLADGPLRQPELADTLATLDDFYRGPVAHAAPAPFAAADFAAHEAEWVTPLHASFAGTEVYELPHNSRGHLALEAIRHLEPLDGLGVDDPELHARLIRSLRAAVFGGDTIYLCVVDGSGMAVSLNQSLFMAFGSGLVVPGTGVLLHNRGASHTKDSYRAGARPVHTLAPAMALAEGRPRLVFGTMGGDAQIQIHLQLLARILVAGQPVEEALAAPRWTFDRTTLLVEDGLTLDPPAGMAAVRLAVPELAGHAHAIRVRSGELDAGCGRGPGSRRGGVGGLRRPGALVWGGVGRRARGRRVGHADRRAAAGRAGAAIGYGRPGHQSGRPTRGAVDSSGVAAKVCAPWR